MFEHVISDDVADLVRLYEPGIELVSIERPERSDLNHSAQRCIEAKIPLSARGVFVVGDRESFAAATQGLRASDGSVDVLLDDVYWCAEVFGELLGCSSVGFRLQTLREPMCPKFHVDRIPCRLLVTYGGPGTEWIPDPWVDRSSVGGFESDNYPIRQGGHHSSLASEALSILKGATWTQSTAARGSPEPAIAPGVVHRSPQTTQGRILLSFDPM